MVRWAVTAAAMTLALASALPSSAPASGGAGNGVTATPNHGARGAGWLIMFHAPTGEDAGTDYEASYQIVVRAPGDCLRRSFPDADTSTPGRAVGSLVQFGKVQINNGPFRRVLPDYINEADRVTIAMTALAPCGAAPYQVRVIYENAFETPGSTTRTTVGHFTTRVTGEIGTLPVTGVDARMLLALGAALLAIGSSGLRLAGRRHPRALGGRAGEKVCCEARAYVDTPWESIAPRFPSEHPVCDSPIMLSRDQVLDVAGQVEAHEPDEALSVVLTVELSAAERAEMLDEIQQVIDALRRRGRSPRVVVRRSETARSMRFRSRERPRPSALT